MDVYELVDRLISIEAQMASDEHLLRHDPSSQIHLIHRRKYFMDKWRVLRDCGKL